ncbi:hypothetical protein BDZ89DRAFT_1128992 [Hymenopellis radicata]|nr:hypothetical protein BDZ89DRAFT_1128992 [Hymenopellis radicata]
MPADRESLRPKWRSLSQLATIIFNATIIVPETARSNVLLRRVPHPYAHAYAATHPLMRTVKSNEQVDWATPPPLYERAIFNWNEQEPVEPQQLRAVRVVFDEDENHKSFRRSFSYLVPTIVVVIVFADWRYF